MRLIKWILRFVISIAVFLLLIVLIPVALMYKNATPPEVIPFETTGIISNLEDQFDNLIARSNNINDISLEFSEDEINYYIHNLVLDIFSENLAKEYDYLLNFDDLVFVKGIWVTLSKDTFNINVSIHINYKDFTFKTRLLVAIKIIDVDTTYLTLKIKKINIGSLPLSWVLRIAPSIANILDIQTIDNFIEEMVGPFGTYNTKNQQIKIDVKKLLTNENEESLLTDALDLFSNSKLLTFNVLKIKGKYEVEIKLNLSKIRTTKDHLTLIEEDRIRTEEAFGNFFQNKTISILLQQAILFNEKELSIILDYMFENADVLSTNKITEKYDYTYIINRPYFEINTKSYLNIPISIGKEEDHFETNLRLEVIFAKHNNDLNLLLSNITLGKLDLNIDSLTSILALLNNDALNIDGSKFVIKDFFKLFNDQPMKVRNINIANENLSINFDTIDTKEALDEIFDELPNEIMKDISQSILDKIQNNEDITDDIDDFLKEFDNLSDQEKEDLLSKAEEYFGNIFKDYPIDKQETGES